MNETKPLGWDVSNRDGISIQAPVPSPTFAMGAIPVPIREALQLLLTHFANHHATQAEQAKANELLEKLK